MIRYINGKEKGQVADLHKKNEEQHSFSRSRKKNKASTKEDLHSFLLKYYVANIEPVEEFITEDDMSNFQKLTSLEYVHCHYAKVKTKKIQTTRKYSPII